VVSAEWSTAQPGQVRSSDCWNDRSAACGDSVSVVAGVNLPVADKIEVLGVVLDWCLMFRKHVSVVVQSCSYMHRPSDDLTHSTSADYGTCTDPGLQSDPVQDQLLQYCAPWHFKLQHQEAAAYAEQHSSDRS